MPGGEAGDVPRSVSVGRGSSLGYRPQLDGLRTVAVYLVVAFHAGLGVLSGGFVGVDIFFVLSGFLVTRILMRDLVSVGRVRFRRFYSRRVRRILPAAVLVLVGTALVYAVIASPVETFDALGGFRAAFVYIANWYFIHQSTDYFAANINANPVLHFWSLAVEEQFYLVWPLLFGGLYVATRRVGRWRWWVLRSVVAGAAVGSAVAAWHLASTNLDRAYYGTDTRAYQLLAGAGLALTPQLLGWGMRRRVARVAAVLALAGLLMVATSAFGMSPITRGVFVAGLAVVLIAALENTGGGLVQRGLSSAPFTYLGRISYGVYLWHWPVIVIAAHGRSLSPLALFAISCAIATPLAALSFHLVEHPIRSARRLDRFMVPSVAFGLATSIVCAVIVMPAILDSGSPSVSALTTAGNSATSLRLLDWRTAKNDIPALPDCLGKPVQKCVVVNGTGPHVLLMGDSHARMWIPAFTAIAKQRNWNLAVASYPTCVWQDNLEPAFTTLDACRARQADWYGRVIPQLDPALIFVSHQALDDPKRPLALIGLKGIVRSGASDYEPTIMNASAAALHALERPGRKIVILEPTPDAPTSADPLSCLSRGTAPARCTYQANTQPTPLERFYRAQAERPDITSLDLDHVVCPRWPTCDPIINNIIVKRDTNHLTATFALSVAAQLAARLPK